jgi:hypothetical protein
LGAAEGRVFRGGLVAVKILALVLGLLVIAVAQTPAGCGGTREGAAAVGGAASTLSPMMQAYYRAHPGYVDGKLQPVDSTAEEITTAIRLDLDPDHEVWLPTYLPPGFQLAAPYNGDGTGSPYPNPYAWGRGYSVTYTDGGGYIMVLAGSDDDLSQGGWELLAETVGGRPLRLQIGLDIILVATVDDGELPLLIAGAGFAEDKLAMELTRVAASLARH